MITPLLLTVQVAIPNHPSKLTYPSYEFVVPQAEVYREELDNGVVVFIAEDRQLPLINIEALFAGGEFLNPEGSSGLAGVTAMLMRAGGTASLSAEELDERIEFLGAEISVSSSNTSSSASLNCLTTTFDDAFDLFVDVIKTPGFQESRVELERNNFLEAMKQRNDNPGSIVARELNNILYSDSYLSDEPTEHEIRSMSVEQLKNMHQSIFSPNNLVLAVSGDFEREEMLQTLNSAFGQWSGAKEAPSPPDVLSSYEPGIYYVDQDIPQGSVRIAIRTLKRDDVDAIASTIMNHILGGSGFTSRITRRVRSDEGLAYSAGSRFNAGVWSDGVWTGRFDTKSSTVAVATQIVFEEIERMKNELVSEEDLNLAKSALSERLPLAFSSTDGMLGVFASDELTEQDAEYWKNYRANIQEVTPEDVKRVANRLLHPSQMAVLIVGDWDEIKGGDINKRATIEDIQSIFGGDVVEIPLKDPMTLEPIQ